MKQDLHIVLGLGATGYACARYLTARGIPVAFADTRAAPPFLEAIRTSYPHAAVHLGALDDDFLAQAAVLVVSPGIAISEPVLVRLAARGVVIKGDIELFAQAVQAPVVAITGTNAKSTVTTLVYLMAQAAGLKCQVGGNLGTPALDLLALPDCELYILELSSFQLETTQSLRPAVATILNITPDHLDRHSTMVAYRAAKHRIYDNCLKAVWNRDDVLTVCSKLAGRQNSWAFTLDEPRTQEFGLRKQGATYFLAREDQLLIAINELPVAGKHYYANALAALAIGESLGLPLATMLTTLKTFQGLPHRCQWLRERHGITWYNDSKGTNVGATMAAVEGLGSMIAGKVIIIAGGVGKNADFTPLLALLQKYTRFVILLGEAAPNLAQVIKNTIPYKLVATMAEAVELAGQVAQAGDSVLLSPACASYDMFKNFEHRGEVFQSLVLGLA